MFTSSPDSLRFGVAVPGEKMALISGESPLPGFSSQPQSHFCCPPDGASPYLFFLTSLLSLSVSSGGSAGLKSCVVLVT